MMADHENTQKTKVRKEQETLLLAVQRELFWGGIMGNYMLTQQSIHEMNTL